MKYVCIGKSSVLIENSFWFWRTQREHAGQEAAKFNCENYKEKADDKKFWTN